MAALVVVCGVMTPSFTETAVANGDTRTINLYYVHTQESISATYLVNGQYDRNVLQQLNWFLRDWRRDEPTNMDPRLFDVVWEAYRSAGVGGEVIKVVSAYRSPATNAMLRSRSRAVAKYSQHMLGKAMDTTMPGMPMSRIREIGMRMQRGGVGYYPNAGTPFVHLDVGDVRAWPRMSYEQLVQLFPDGKTVHLPSNGQPLPGYEEAKAEIEARNNGAIVMAPRRSSSGFLAFLFGGGEDEAEDAVAPAPEPPKQWSALAPRPTRGGRAAVAESDEEGGGETANASGRRGREVLAKAEADLPRGETVMSAGSVDAAAAAKAEAAARAEAAKAAAAAAKAEAAERDRLARAPLPPQRPVALEQAAPLEPGPAEKRLATREEDNAASIGQASGEESVVPNQERAGDIPLPPRRPSHLAAVSEVPLPPTRPTEFALVGRGSLDSRQETPADTTASVAATAPPPRPRGIAPYRKKDDAGALSNLIDATESAHGAAKVKATPSDHQPLAFAPSSAKGANAAAKVSGGKSTIGKATAGPRAEFVPARLDPSNFRAMTTAAPASRASSSSVMGTAVGGLRAAAQASDQDVLQATESGTKAGFSGNASIPATDKFGAGAE